MKHFSSLVRSLMIIPESPTRIALAYSLGVLIGFSPVMGLHTALGVSVALLFRLNQAAVLLGVWTNLPWIVVPYYAFATWFGIKIFGLPEGISLPHIGFFDLITLDFWSRLIQQWRLLIPAVLGSGVLCVLFALIAYPLALSSLRRYKRKMLSTFPPEP